MLLNARRKMLAGSTGIRMAPLFAALLRPAGTIFMLHRFTDDERGSAGHNPALLRENLAALRREKRELVSVQELVHRSQEGRSSIGGAIAFTVDDGYADFASVAASIFAEYDCPVTVFLVTGVIDSRGWYWWDRIAAAFELSRRKEVSIRVGERLLQRRWSSAGERGQAALELIGALKQVTEEDRLKALAVFEETLDVSLPTVAPARFASMTWSEVRACARMGVTFGPHTVSHPILSQVGDAQARQEIEGSWLRLWAETEEATKIFAYPNGKSVDFTARDVRILQQMGFIAAVTATPSYVVSGRGEPSPDDEFRIPRFGYPDTRGDFLQITSGMQRISLSARRAMLMARGDGRSNRAE